MNSDLRLLREPQYDVLILGAGFSGLGMAVGLLKKGRRSFIILERGDDVGGTWRDNTYPGCACDIPSALYSFSFKPNPNWSRAYPPQAEIQAYLRQVRDDYRLSPHIQLRKRAVSMTFDDHARMWRVETHDGDVFTARVVVSGVGGLSNPILPEIEGIERFQGRLFHSARWDHDYDLTGKAVAVVGAGASVIQFMPEIAPKVGQLHVFQRTPPWIIPKRDRAITRFEQILFALAPSIQRLWRACIYWRHEANAVGFLGRLSLLKRAQRRALEHMRAAIQDPDLREALTPRYVMGCKRVLISNDYYPALARDNVELITAPIVEITNTGVVTADGRERAVDAIILGTGFAAIDMLKDITVIGTGGRQLADDWAQGAQAHLGLTVAGYPNLFLLMGPNTALGHNSIIYMIESQIRFVLDALRLMDRKRISVLDTRKPAQDAFVRMIADLTAKTVWNAGGCQSWYLTASGRNTVLWPGFTFDYRRRTRKLDPRAYQLEPSAEIAAAASGMDG